MLYWNLAGWPPFLLNNHDAGFASAFRTFMPTATRGRLSMDVLL
jgi:hypothetical protein